MKGDVDVAAAAALIADPARATLLLSLMHAEALPASALAARAGIARSTASAHLARLVAARFLIGDRVGRHRIFRLADPAVAEALEALSVIAPTKPVRSLRDAAAGEAIRAARTCYDHLAGRLGVELASALERERVVVLRGGAYAISAPGASRLSSLGIDVPALVGARRATARPCLDWSERRPHIAGALGAALADRFFELGWLRRRQANRSVEVTAAGRVALEREFGLEL